MEKSSPIWREYLILDDKVNIRSTDGSLDKRVLFPNIDDILVMENRISFLNDVKKYEILINNEAKELNYKDFLFFGSGVFISSQILNMILLHTFPKSTIIDTSISISYILLSFLTKNLLDIKRQNIISDSCSAIIKLCDVEIENCNNIIEDLLKEEINESEFIRNKFIPVDEDVNYYFEFISREFIFSDYGKDKKILISKDKKGLLDQYLDSIGCSSEDKLIFMDLLNIEKLKTEKSFQYRKK